MRLLLVSGGRGRRPPPVRMPRERDRSAQGTVLCAGASQAGNATPRCCTGCSTCRSESTCRATRDWNACLLHDQAHGRRVEGRSFCGRDQLRKVGLGSPGHKANVKGAAPVAEHQVRLAGVSSRNTVANQIAFSCRTSMYKQVPSSCRYASPGPISVSNSHTRARAALLDVESTSTPVHRAQMAAVSASRSMRHPPASPSTTTRNVTATIYQASVSCEYRALRIPARYQQRAPTSPRTRCHRSSSEELQPRGPPVALDTPGTTIPAVRAVRGRNRGRRPRGAAITGA